MVERLDLSEESWLDFFNLSKRLTPDLDSFQVLWDLHPEEIAVVKIWNNEIPVPRFQQSYLRDYKFSGVVSKAKPLPEEFQPYLDWINGRKYGIFNEVLVNWYADGRNYVCSHNDDERQLVPGSPIVTITLTGEGLPRIFRFRTKTDKSIVQDFETHNGNVIVMGGKCQKEFKHEIVKVTGKKVSQMAPRISITLRQFRGK